MIFPNTICQLVLHLVQFRYFFLINGIDFNTYINLTERRTICYSSLSVINCFESFSHPLFNNIIDAHTLLVTVQVILTIYQTNLVNFLN